MGSFKLKLVLYFAVLALVPSVVVFRSFDALARRGETRAVDARLHAGLRAARATVAIRLDRAWRTASDLAASVALRRALRTGDRAAVADAVRGARHVTVETSRFTVGRPARLGGARSVRVVDHGRTLGRVTVGVPFDAEMLRHLRSGLAADDQLVVLHEGRVVAGPYRGERVAAPRPRPARLTIDGRDFRALAAERLGEPVGYDLVALTPQPAISAATRRAERSLLLFVGGALVVLALVTYLIGRSVIRSLDRLAEGADALARGDLRKRVEVSGRDELAQLGTSFNRMAAELEQRMVELEDERRRLRETTARFGEALQATHDLDQLLRVIVETAVEATGAQGGIIVDDGRELARAGDFDASLEKTAFPLRAGIVDLGALVLAAPAFDADKMEAATSLAANAAIALENARLHRIVERQALVDPLTELANRRALEETLHAESARAARFGGDLCLVITDLDDFKAVNDRWGHPSGDIVLRAFGRLLRETVREIDVAGRWGGEEFAVIMPGTDATGGVTLAERVRAAIEATELRSTDGGPVRVTASFGVASFADAASVEALVAAADDALYRAKRAGKNRVVYAVEPVAGEPPAPGVPGL